jgi:hypothetical protein
MIMKTKLEELEETAAIVLQQIKDLKEAEVKQTFTPVSFKTQWDWVMALKDGRKFTLFPGSENIIYYDETVGGSPFRHARYSLGAAWSNYTDLFEVNATATPWYLNIPKEGVDCYASNYDRCPDTRHEVVTIYKYKSHSSTPFWPSVNEGTWTYATPVDEALRGN